MEIRRFVPADIELLTLQPAQSYLRPLIAGTGYGEALAQGDAFTGVVDGRVVACGGIYPTNAGKTGHCWMMISEDAGRHFIAVHRAVVRAIEVCTMQRLEATVDCDFTEGHIWLDMLGFDCEAPRMRKYTPDGRDAALYARVQ